MIFTRLKGGYPSSTSGKESWLPMQETQGSIPGSGRSPRVGNNNLLQYSCLENSTDKGAWWAAVHGVAKSQTQHTHTHTHTQQHQHESIEPGWRF